MTKIYNRIKDKEKRRALRRAMTPAENLLWQFIRKKGKTKYRFKRQYSIKGFVLDYYCPKVKLCIEVDGRYHQSRQQQAYDKERTLILNSLGINVIRFNNEQIIERPDIITDNINKIADKLLRRSVIPKPKNI